MTGKGVGRRVGGGPPEGHLRGAVKVLTVAREGAVLEEAESVDRAIGFGLESKLMFLFPRAPVKYEHGRGAGAEGKES